MWHKRFMGGVMRMAGLVGLIICISAWPSMARAGSVPLLTSTHKPPVMLYVTVDWEGISLEDDNIAAIEAFRRRYPTLPMLHLLNPAYFIPSQHSPVALAAVRAQIARTQLPIDTIGLHLHGWQRLVEHCGLPYQDAPQFAEPPAQLTDAGLTVSLTEAYRVPQLTQLLRCASDLLVAQGFSAPRHFRAGGWQLGPALISALTATGFVWDSSVIDATLLTTRWAADSPLVQSLKRLHPKVSPLAQPYALNPQLIEYPNNAGFADYQTVAHWLQLFEALLASEKRVLVLGFHQETAADYLPRLTLAIQRFSLLANQYQRPMVWCPAVACDLD